MALYDSFRCRYVQHHDQRWRAPVVEQRFIKCHFNHSWPIYCRICCYVGATHGLCAMEVTPHRQTVWWTWVTQRWTPSTMCLSRDGSFSPCPCPSFCRNRSFSGISKLILPCTLTQGKLCVFYWHNMTQAQLTMGC